MKNVSPSSVNSAALYEKLWLICLNIVDVISTKVSSVHRHFRSIPCDVKNIIHITLPTELTCLAFQGGFSQKVYPGFITRYNSISNVQSF